MGPPTYPAKVGEFDFSPGGVVAYSMTGPAGEIFSGKWTITSIDPSTSLEYVDGDTESDDSGTGMPVTTWTMQLSEQTGRTRMELRSRFASGEQMEQMIEMGTEEGHAVTIGQMDALLKK